MLDIDDTLQNALADIESGTPLETVLTTLPPDDQGLGELLRLADALRTVPQPAPNFIQAQANQQRILRAAQQTSPWPTNNGHKSAKHAPRVLQPLSRMTVFGIAGAAVLLLVMIAGAVGLGFYITGPSAAKAATVMDISGQVQVASLTSSTNPWKPLANGELLRSGQRIKTGPDSDVTLVFFDGSRTNLGPNSDVTLSRLSGKYGNVINIELYQQAGETANSVVPFRSQKASFLIKTPSGQAAVRGTRFNVIVAQSGETLFSVNTGKVLVSNANSQVSLVSGQASEAMPGKSPTDPAYQFSVQGTVATIHDHTWVVAGVEFIVSDQTQIGDGLGQGSNVLVQGRIVANGDWVADSIEPSSSTQQVLSFTGQIESMQGDTWIISGISIKVDSSTDKSEGLVVGDSVQVTYIAQDEGTRLALKIKSPDTTPDPNANPDLEFRPDKYETKACATDFTVHSDLVNKAENQGDFASNVELSYVLDEGASYIERVEANPSNFDRIDAGQSEPLDVHVVLKPEWKGTENSAKVKLHVFVSHETNRQDKLGAILVIAVTSDCGKPKPSETVTPSPSSTMTPTSTITTTVTVTPTITIPSTSTITSTQAITNCVGANPQPEGQRLAQVYGVSYNEIMGWFCQGFGFGEIQQAYELSRQYNIPVTQLFDLRKSGLGWGEIKQQLEQKTPGPNGGNGNGNGNGNDNGNGNNNGHGRDRGGKPTKEPKPSKEPKPGQ